MASNIANSALVQRAAVARTKDDAPPPDRIQLLLCAELILGRYPGLGGITLTSPNLPGMISRKHASIKHDQTTSQWVLKDLSSTNGVYLNQVRLSTNVPTPVCHGDHIKFGVNVDTNILSYVFTDTSKGCPVLIREPSAYSLLQLQRPVKRQCSFNTPVKAIKKPRTDGVTSPSTSGLASVRSPLPTPTIPKNSSSRSTRSNSSTPPITPRKGRSQKKTPTVPARTPSLSSSMGTDFTPPNSLASSSAFSLFSPLDSKASSSTLTIDSLFDSKTTSPREEMEEAIFGKSPVTPRAEAVLNGVGLSVAKIQAEMVQDKLEKKNNKLLAKCQAIKDELAVMDHLLIEKDKQQAKAIDDVFSSIEDEMTCAICHDLFVSAYTLPCAHSFCEWCITEWMNKNHYKECPVCRAVISSKPVHSIAMDNSIKRLIARLTPEEKEQRKMLENEHAKSLGKVTTPLCKTVSLSTIDHSPIVIISDDELSLELDSDVNISSDDSSVSGDDYAYFGGYGRCFRCGRRGHWARGCPYM